MMNDQAAIWSKIVNRSRPDENGYVRFLVDAAYKDHAAFLTSLYNNDSDLSPSGIVKKLGTMCVRYHPTLRTKKPSLVDVFFHVSGTVVTLIPVESR
jgi:hypothetical protein